MKSTISLFIIAVLFSMSCGDDNKKAKDQLYDKVMAVHDEIMPKMGDITKYKKQLTVMIDELIEAGREENEARIAELKKAVEDLENSHDGMMNWMRAFDNDFEGKVHEEVMEYLEDQKTRIEKVGKETNTALKNAEKLLTK